MRVKRVAPAACVAALMVCGAVAAQQDDHVVGEGRGTCFVPSRWKTSEPGCGDDFHPALPQR